MKQVEQLQTHSGHSQKGNTVTFIQECLVQIGLLYSRKKSKQGQSSRTGGHFCKKNPGIFSQLGLSLYLWKFQRKEGFIPGNSEKLWYTLSLAWKFQDQKPRPMEIPHEFSLIDQLITLESPLLFSLTPGISSCSFFNTHVNCISSIPSPPCPLPPVFGFFWNSMHNISKKQ